MSANVQPSRVLKDLGPVAILGSDRAGKDAPAPRQLLNLAAVAGSRARAGRRLAAEASPIGECPQEPCPLATPRQESLLLRLLGEMDAALIVEWCTHALAKAVRVPPAAVPGLLAWWARQNRRAPEVLAAAGTCGSWLAGLNPDWNRPVATAQVPANAEDLWQTGSILERMALLQTVRAQDPARGVELLRSTWSADAADDRRKFVELLLATVCPGDEPFLEAALDDKSKQVRREAARALARLPGSGLRARMTERAKPTITITKSKGWMLGREKMAIAIEPPKAYDPSWKRDAIEETPADKGQRAFWFTQLVAGSDLSALARPSGLEPAAFLEALSGDAFYRELLAAMTTSAATCPGQPGCVQWAEAIIARSSERAFEHLQELSPLWMAQDQQRSEALRLSLISGWKGGTAQHMWKVLAADPRPWSQGFSQQAAMLLRKVHVKREYAWEMGVNLWNASHLLHPAAAEAFESIITESYPDKLDPNAAKSLVRIRLRAEMYREFYS
jgi:hypothetical protein